MVVKQCCTAMLINDIDISFIMVHSQHIEEENLKERSKEVKRAKNGDGNFSLASSDGHGHPRFRQRFSGLLSSNAPPKFKNYRVSNPKTQGGNGNGSSLPMPTCTKCGKMHECKSLFDMDGCFDCGKSGHKMRVFLILATKEIGKLSFF